MASDQLWGSLVKAMTKKIEIPRIPGNGASPTASPYRPPPTPSIEEPPEQRVRTGRRSADTTSSAPRPTRTDDSSAPVAATPSVTSATACVERVTAHLSYLTRQQVEDYLGHHGGPDGHIAGRLMALGLLPEGLRPAGAEFWWKCVSKGWVEPELLAEVLRSAPGMPEHHEGLLTEHILDMDIAPYKEVKAAAQRALESGTPLLTILEEGRTITASRAADISSEFYGLPRKRGKKWHPDASQVGILSVEFARAFGVIPMSQGDDSRDLTLLGTRNPGPVVSETLNQLTGRDVGILIETKERWEAGFSAWQDAIEAERSAREGRSAKRGPGKPGRKREVFRFDQNSFAGITYVPEMVQAIMERATAVGATDIHLEPQGEGMRVRYRLDGILHDAAHLRVNMGEDTISRIKVMADMDITERRKPQDGHVHHELSGRPFDFRIATVPTSNGERMSIRITAASKEVPSLDVLGLLPDERKLLLDFTKRSHGIVLACGPVGSGKTTTLYAALGELDSQQRNIMSIEDPVEIELPNVSQVNVNYKLGMDFSSGLRALLRQDPNIILIGEIRDDETAKVAVRGSLTGLLVFSSIHANSAPGAITTLYNFDIPPFLLATSIVGVIAQRLVRSICPTCRESYEPAAALLAQAGIEIKAGRGKNAQRYFRGRGCDACYGTGYRGRSGIFEILDIEEDIRLAISERAPEAKIREMAVAGGMVTLADRGRGLVLNGETTVEEFIRVLYQ
jgi:type II secretory ATPase GspE/PulE/Tfp pilus assembly ATPase PilB-like protein